ncbi:MAG: hypothetical protein K9W43_14110 [Candidatus Thorarchaeota archaeon]|nr:hypothetical protein [Candidatus Thorarchaeota archaeon]
MQNTLIFKVPLVTVMNNKSSTLVLIGFAIFLITAVPSVAPVNALKMSYFPLSPGNYLVYNSTDDTGTWSTKRYVAEETEFLGGPFGTFTILWCESQMQPGESNYTWVNQMWLSKTDDTLVWWGFEDESAKIIVTNGLAYVTEPVKEGAVHRGSTVGTLTLKADGTQISNVPFSANYTIDSIETVTVPAGTFENCIKVHEEELTPDGHVSFWVWYAPNVGAIQYHYPDSNDRWDKLVEYSVDTENDPWDTWLLPKVPMILTVTVIAISALVAIIIVVKIVRTRRA